MKILSIIGTRPNFVKEALMNKELESNNIEEVLLHTGQHYDFDMSQAFFNDFNIMKPKYILGKREKTNVRQTSLMMNYIEDVIIKERPDYTMVYGDVNSTLAGAIASAKNKIKVIHIEGGVRSEYKYNPEEINRRLSDQLSELIFTCTKTDNQNLLNEGFGEKRIFFSGDLVKDILLKTIKKNNLFISNNGYNILTLHREENILSKERLSDIIEGLILSEERIIFPVHPRTYTKLKELNLLKRIKSNSRIEMTSPKKYSEFIELLCGASKVITDSGGVRREAYILKKPSIILINIIWFPEILKAGWMKVVDADAKKIVNAIHTFDPKKSHPNIFGNGDAHKKIVKKILDFYRNG